MNNGADFDKLAQDLAAARMMLRERVGELKRLREELEKRHLPAIRKWAANAAEKRDTLRQAIKDSPEYFAKPKTRIMHDIKFGYRKEKGEIFIGDEDKAVMLIKKHLGEQADILIRSKETVVKSALAQIPAADLKRIGVTVENDTDEVFIKEVDSEIDRIVNALLAAYETEEE